MTWRWPTKGCGSSFRTGSSAGPPFLTRPDFLAKPRARERTSTRAGAFARHALDHGEQHVLQPLVVRVEHFDDALVRHGFNARDTIEARIVVGDQRDIHVTDLELAREVRFRILC